MKKDQVIVASITDGGVKVEVGRTTMDLPETVQEICDNFDEKDIVRHFLYGLRVSIQDELRRGSNPKTPLSKFRKAGKDKQDKIMELARAQGLID